MTPRASTIAGTDVLPTDGFAADVEYYLSLTPRQLPSRYFYDDLGSVLFEAICRLPWYTITRAEMRLLRAHRRDVLERVAAFATVVELGPGSGEKLRVLLDASACRQATLTVHLVDVSASALAAAAATVEEAGAHRVVTHRTTYDAGLRDAAAQSAGPTLVAFLGSSLGNFDPPGAAAFLRNLRGSIRPGDALLVGVDLVKPARRLLLAYDDPLGVTAAFNRNLLVRINRELGADADVNGFEHSAVWNEAESRIEMHLVAHSPQRVHLPGAAAIHLETGDSIWTESSYKYRPEQIAQLLRSAGFTPAAQWIDREDQFALTMAVA